MEIDAFLADSVVSAEGKLFVQGGGWNVIWARSFPVRQPRIGLAAVVHVPWTETNRKHRLEVRLEDADGQVLPLAPRPPDAPEEFQGVVRAEFNVGRPSSVTPGDEQVVPIAMNFDGIRFPAPETYRFVVSVDDVPVKALSIRCAPIEERKSGGARAV